MDLIKFCAFGALLFIVAGCSPKADNLAQPSLNSVTPNGSVSITSDNVPGDNYTNALIHIEITNPGDFPGGLGLTLKTDHGTFLNGTDTYPTKIGTDGKLDVSLKDGRAEAATVTVSNGTNFVKSVIVHFTTAFPDLITVQPAQATIGHSGNIEDDIKAMLSRVNGLPSMGQAVSFYDSTSVGARSVGTFLNTVVSDAGGNATSQYYLQDTTYRGYVFLKAYVTAAGKKVIGQTRILIK